VNKPKEESTEKENKKKCEKTAKEKVTTCKKENQIERRSMAGGGKRKTKGQRKIQKPHG